MKRKRCDTRKRPTAKKNSPVSRPGEDEQRHHGHEGGLARRVDGGCRDRNAERPEHGGRHLLGHREHAPVAARGANKQAKDDAAEEHHAGALHRKGQKRSAEHDGRERDAVNDDHRAHEPPDGQRAQHLGRREVGAKLRKYAQDVVRVPVAAHPSGMIQLSIDGETLEVPLELMRLYQSLAVRIAAQQLIEEPLKKPEIESFEVREDGHVVISVNKDESSYFAASVIPDEFVNEDVWRMAFSIISLAFKEDNKWRLYDGNTQISATIEDGEFLARVEASLESFSKGDMLVCDVKMTQTRTSGGLKTEYVVVRVVEHRPAARQIGFFTEDESGGSEPDGGDE